MRTQRPNSRDNIDLQLAETFERAHGLPSIRVSAVRPKVATPTGRVRHGTLTMFVATPPTPMLITGCSSGCNHRIISLRTLELTATQPAVGNPQLT